MQSGVEPHPVQSPRARNHLDLNAGLFEQRSRFQSALAGPDDDDTLPLELSQIIMLARVRSQRRRNGRELRGPGSKRADSGGYHQPPRCEFLSVGHDHFEPVRVDFHVTKRALIYIRHGAALVPTTVVDKTLQRNRLRYVVAVLTAIFIKRQLTLRIGNVRGAPIRAQTHAHRHLLLPKRHRLAKNTSFYARRAQISRRGEAIRACPNNRHITIR